MFFIIFAAVSIGACGTLPPTVAPVSEARPVTAAKAVVPAPLPAARAPPVTGGDDMLFHALLASGVDYRRGGKSHQSGFDCSGLVAHVYRQAYGLALPHNTKSQSELGDAVDLSELQPGDLVFFNTLDRPFSHVGIYVGDDRFIHAPKEGAVVRTESIRVRYWTTRFDGARRIVPVAVNADYAPAPKKPVVTFP